MKGLYNIYHTTARQAVREPIFFIVAGIFSGLVYGTQFLVMFVFEGQTSVLMETGIASISSCGVLLSILLSWLLIRKEMERMSILSVLSKPVSRFSFVAGKYLGLLYAVGSVMVFLFFLFLLNLWQMNSGQMLDVIQERIYTEFLADGRAPGWFGVIWAGARTGLGHFFQKWIVPGVIGTVPAFLSVAMVLAVCSVSSLYLNVLSMTALTVGFLFLGSISGNLFYALTGSGSIFAGSIGWMIHLLLPDLQRLNIATDVGSRLARSRWELFTYYWPFLIWSTVSSLLYAGAILTAGSALFQRKEIR